MGWGEWRAVFEVTLPVACASEWSLSSVTDLRLFDRDTKSASL